MKKPSITQDVYKVASQFLRRKKKEEQKQSETTEVVVQESVASDTSSENIEANISDEEIVAPVEVKEEPVYTNVAFDIFEDTVDKKYKAVVVRYNPATLQVEISEVLPVTRSVGMSYIAQKLAIKTILKK